MEACPMQNGIAANLSALQSSTMKPDTCNQLYVCEHTQTTSDDNSLPLTKLMLDHFREPAIWIDRKLDYLATDLWVQRGDPRSSELPFISAGPWKLIFATVLYLYLIKRLLPNLMNRKRTAFELNWPIRCYNLLMVLSNMYAFYHGARILQFGRRCFGCEVINPRDYSPQTLELLHYGWLFFMSRLVEWMDTIFFVLRKKQRQVTKLHVFHHSFVPLLCWTYLKFHPGYTVAFFPFVNTFVHTIMYTYYFLATFGPKVQGYLWWKRYLTSIQIAQFVLILLQLATIPLSTNEQCQYPKSFLYVAIGGAVLFLWLFYTYYRETYKYQHLYQQDKQQDVDKAQKSTFKLKNYTTQSRYARGSREGTSRALSDAIENAIDSFAAK